MNTPKNASSLTPQERHLAEMLEKYGSGKGTKNVTIASLVEALGCDPDDCCGQLAEVTVGLPDLVEALVRLGCPEASRTKLLLDGTIPGPAWPARPSPRDPALLQALSDYVRRIGDEPSDPLTDAVIDAVLGSEVPEGRDGAEGEQWAHARSADDFFTGPYPSREAAVLAGNDDDGCDFVIGKVGVVYGPVWAVMAALNVGDLSATADEAVCDEVGADDTCIEISSSAAQDLERRIEPTVRRWVRDHGIVCGAFTVDRETIEPIEGEILR